MKNVLFVCTGNTFRSPSAEYLLKKISDHDIYVSSAGTRGNKRGVFPETIEAMDRYGLDISNHQYRILNQKIVDDSDIIISMTHAHKDYILDNFSRDSYLFNELAVNESTDLMDDAEAKGEYSDLKKFIFQTVDTIHDGIPSVYEKIKSL